MNWELFAAFLAVSIVVIIVPGPNVTLIVATAASRGVGSGLATVAGTSSAQMVQLLMVFGGLAWLVSAYGTAFDLLRFAGAAYLIWLGWQTWRHAGDPLPDAPARRLTFRRGFLVALANPKTLAFYAAFMPQFVDTALPTTFQLIVLSVSFLVLATLLDGLYAVVAGYGGRMLTSAASRKWLGRASGAVLAGGGVWLATIRRSG